MQKPLYADAIDYFEKLEKKHDYQANKAKWQGRSEAEIENIQRKKEYARMAAEALREVWGIQSMKVGDRIRNMNNEELAKFLSEEVVKVEYACHVVFDKPFGEDKVKQQKQEFFEQYKELMEKEI